MKLKLKLKFIFRAENDNRKENVDRMFAKSGCDDAFALYLLFGPDASVVLSNDDKARIPLGLTAANKQAPILMHMSYKVRLADHDFTIAKGHKLIPSVYAECVVLEDGKVSYSGTTHVRIRSGKHDSSTARTHAYDIRELFLSGSIKKKPIVIISTDGGPDESPRYPKTLMAAVSLFKVNYMILESFEIRIKIAI